MYIDRTGHSLPFQASTGVLREAGRDEPMSNNLPTSIGPQQVGYRTATLCGGVRVCPFLGTHTVGDAKMHRNDE